mgnify:CR=1 FL=1
MAVKNKVQLITYADSLGGDLKTLIMYLQNIFQINLKVVFTYFLHSLHQGIEVLHLLLI